MIFPSSKYALVEGCLRGHGGKDEANDAEADGHDEMVGKVVELASLVHSVAPVDERKISSCVLGNRDVHHSENQNELF